MSVNSFRQDEEQKMSLNREVIVRLFKYLIDYKKTIILVLCIMALTIAIALINPLIVERAIDVHIAQGDIPGLLKLGAFALAINIAYLLLLKARTYIMSKMSNQILVSIRQQLYCHIQKLSFGFFDSRPTGKILARIIGDVNSLKDVLSESVTTLIPDIITIIAVAILMLAINPKLSLAAIATLPLLIATLFVIEKITHKRWQTHRRKSSNLNAFIHESLAGIRVVQSFSAEDETLEDFDQLIDEYEDSFIKAVQVTDALGPAIDIMWAAGTALLYIIAVNWLGLDGSNVGLLLAFATYMSMFWSPIRNLSNFYNKLITNMSAAERVFEILDTKPEIADREGVVELPRIKGEVRFDHVTFAYSDDRETKVLRDVSFTAQPGETIALVGPTGAGKTTIVNLISRFYDIDEGDILIDGHSLRDVSINSLRRQMGVMTQENFIFSGTVRDNIRYGKLDATDEEIEAAAKAVYAHDFIMKLEKGYDTELTDGGSGLSAGQRQLIAFARTMVSQPQILILDEATSSIDTHTELLVQSGIESLLKGRTSFIIAHRLSTIKKADRIFVIDHGVIREQGSHSQLMQLKGEYYELYRAQFKSLRSSQSE